ncbi:hypothetical protein BU24DRAFT_396887 [Aaosphaeria arxii CBS 175.79]|uniref:WW domain-containing protein n=1 Tax=Aaosphaeria arxii CBS 175.79 TaxID=1450172 RepID=A0A6A5XFZ8_9PLEO|nr:uncharacterized protein BU24DRAFT_396887 [Aaosphaeria arxii CBS 175.79]KAF2012088.1 hypothetical protein BU24DRAFT_396887 [Aaosphaeria arxii CBS 175.79]
MSTQAQPPHEPPPSYEAATDPSPGIQRVSTDGPAALTARNGIPPEHRRSMEDENRPLPPGWIRQFDAQEQHQFFVDTRSEPPRSIWVHPYDDPEYLSTLSPEERKRHSRLHRSMTLDDLAAEDTDPEDDDDIHKPTTTHPLDVRKHVSHPAAAAGPSSLAPAELPARPSSSSSDVKGLHKFGRKMKDRLTSTTHAERETTRARRAEEERQAYQMHLRTRQAMARAVETGQPQFLGKDDQGKDVYIEPPMGYRDGYGGYYGGGGRGAYGYNPYNQGPYTDPNARFVRPVGAYDRQYGYGYGGGIGLPVAAGFLGGAVLGGLLF